MDLHVWYDGGRGLHMHVCDNHMHTYGKVCHHALSKCFQPHMMISQFAIIDLLQGLL